MMERESLLRSAMETYGDTVYRLALCRTQSVPDAEDVYQDVFLKLLGQRTPEGLAHPDDPQPLRGSEKVSAAAAGGTAGISGGPEQAG